MYCLETVRLNFAKSQPKNCNVIKIAILKGSVSSLQTAFNTHVRLTWPKRSRDQANHAQRIKGVSGTMFGELHSAKGQLRC